MARSAMTFGNVTIGSREGIVELSLNTEVRGRAHALFTPNEIPTLLTLLKNAASAATPAESDEDDIGDLV